MSITYSGFYQNNIGQSFLVTQGSAGYTLVTDKKILFRLFLDPTLIARIFSVYAIIKYIGTDIPPQEIIIPFGDLLIENSPPNGPSIGILVQGYVFPSTLPRYKVEFVVLSTEHPLVGFTISDLKFQKSGRLRILVHSIVGTAPWGNNIQQNPGWFFIIGDALVRFAAMLPVSDDATIGLTHTDIAGLCWENGQPIDAWPQICPSGNPPSEPHTACHVNYFRCPKDEIVDRNLAETRQINSEGLKHVDVTVCWRPRDYAMFPPPGEGVGGTSLVDEGDRMGVVNGGNWNGREMTASIMAQEVGHTFGLEPAGSPHFQDPLDHGHSKDPSIQDPFAFDFFRLRPYFPLPGTQFLGDVMNNLGGGVSQGNDSVLYNAYDWEYLRKQLVGLPSISAQNVDEEAKISKENQEKLVSDIEKPFADLPKIDLEKPELILSPKPGFGWHWTSQGFKCLRQEKSTDGGANLTQSAEMILSRLRELGVKKVYAPVEEKPLSIVINPNMYTSVHIHEFDHF